MPGEVIYDFPNILGWHKKVLYKECKPIHVPSTCGTIQIGSLNYFRNHHENEIADKLEGKTFFKLPCLGSWDEVSIWLNNTSLGQFGAMFPGHKCPKEWPTNWPIGALLPITTRPFATDRDIVPGWIKFDFNIVKYPEDPSELVQAVCMAEYTASNAFLFCLKYTLPNENTLKDYSASWRIPRGLVMEFAGRLASSIAKNAAKWSVRAEGEQNARLASELGPWTVGNLADGVVQADGVYILYAVGDVLYVNSPGGMNFSINYPWDWSKRLFFFSPFFKRLDYMDQAETRIAFYLVKRDGDKFIGLNPVEETVLIPIDDDLMSCIVEPV